MHNKHQGVTLVEVLLVIVISALILTLAFQQYNAYFRQGALAQIKKNIDQLLIASSQYYRASCGNLNTFPVSSSKVTIKIQQDLIDKGFLTGWVPDNPLVDKAQQQNGYFVQFLQKDPATMNVTACWNFAGSDGNNQCQTPQQLVNNPNSVIFWTIYVAVKFTDSQKDKDQVKAYARFLGADCTSDSAEKCNDSADQVTYLIWERLPSFAAPEMSSTLWQSMPLLKQFNLQYTHDFMYELQTVPDNYVGSKYYLCGG